MITMSEDGSAVGTSCLSERDKAELLERIEQLKDCVDAAAGAIRDGECVDVILAQLAVVKQGARRFASLLARRHLAYCAAT